MVEIYGTSAASYIGRGLVPATERYTKATVLYMDIVDFTRHCMVKQLDEISTKLKTLTMNLQIAVIAVIHINRQGQVRGSAGPEQVSNNVIRLTRDKKELDEWRRNVTQMDVEKCRLSGRTGPACWVYYDPETGRLSELSPEQTRKFQEGQTLAGDEFSLYSQGEAA